MNPFLDPHAGATAIFGQPHHGLIVDGVLTLPNAATKAVSGITDGHTRLIDIGATAPSRTSTQAARDTANGWEWTPWFIANTACRPEFLNVVYRASDASLWHFAMPNSARPLGQPTAPLRTIDGMSLGSGMSVNNIQAVRPDLKAFLITVDHELWEGEFSDTLGSVPTWSAAWGVSIGQHIKTADGYYRVTTAGSTGASEPTWGGETVSDGSVTWQVTGPPISLTMTLVQTGVAASVDYSETIDGLIIPHYRHDTLLGDVCETVSVPIQTDAERNRVDLYGQMGCYKPDGTPVLIQLVATSQTTFTQAATSGGCVDADGPVDYTGETLTVSYARTQELALIQDGATTLWEAPSYAAYIEYDYAAIENPNYPDGNCAWGYTSVGVAEISKAGSVVHTETASYTNWLNSSCPETIPNWGRVIPLRTTDATGLDNLTITADGYSLYHVAGDSYGIVQSGTYIDIYRWLKRTNNLALVLHYAEPPYSGTSLWDAVQAAHHDGATAITMSPITGSPTSYYWTLNPRTADISHGPTLRAWI